MKSLTTIFLLSLLGGCGHRHVLRDANTYQAEINQYDNWAVQQAKYLRGFIEEHCTCDPNVERPQFNEVKCEEAAAYVLTVEYRHEWHKQMSLYNGGLIEEEPAGTPPDIPGPMCPLPPAPTGSDIDSATEED